MKTLLRRVDREKLVLGLAAPLLAIVTAVVITSLVLLATGDDPFRAYSVMVDFGTKSDSQVWILNKAIPYYLAAVAVAVGFRMNLFNIGVDGQYRVAAFFAAVVGGALSLPGIVQIPLILLTAMVCGGLWAGIAGWLKAARGVSEVITTIMLNFIAGSLIGYFLQEGRLAERDGNIIHTHDIPDSSFFFQISTRVQPINGTFVLAVLAGVAYWLLLSRTRFGFDLRAVGRSEPAAEASGVSVRRTVVTAMLLSGAIAGLVGMPTLLNQSGNYGNDFPEGLGFTGIAIALLGRNNAVGMGFAALLWCFLERTGTQLEFEGYAQEIVGVMQGVIVLSVVVAYELVRRWGVRRQQRMVGEELAARARRAAKEPNDNPDSAEVSA
ncbi:ABC transporter permease [Streptomyces sp. RFCAC02]|uniref:ABC transporter permease n=1 Tax=Streptomyces sp. RFCAC02 TaxID=2499143 RepID=UPI0010227C03|nr:ABC transporter permease [Streptomyces sp. RFCAC02]